MLASINRWSAQTQAGETAYSTEVSFIYLDGDVNTREVKFIAISTTSQEEADEIASAEMRYRVKVMVDFLDSEFPATV